MKLTKRKGFNFFRSYYDVYNELETDKDKVAFMDALLDRQFQGVIPLDLKGMAKFAYISQVNSIDSQVKGYEDKAISLNKTVENYTPWQGVKNISLTPWQQEKGKGKVKGEEQDVIPPTPKGEVIDFDFLLKTINEIFNRKFSVVTDSVKKKYNSLIKQGYSKTSIHNAMLRCKKDAYHIETKFKYCTLEYFSRPKTIDLHGEITNVEPIRFEDMTIAQQSEYLKDRKKYLTEQANIYG